ncbi:MAG: hypothetical protein K2Q10_08880, partial [Rhodospirillales bacterium]|nr:hypothetical protein [Rhodospirillales bacterium]
AEAEEGVTAVAPVIAVGRAADLASGDLTADAVFTDPETTGLPSIEMTDKDHGRIETRRYTVSQDLDWLIGDRRYPDEPRFPALKSLVWTTTRTEWRGKVTEETRCHWGIESLHWILDVIFKKNLSRLHRGHGAQNMALARRLAFNPVRAGRGKRSIKTARKAAGWSSSYLAELLGLPPR